MLTSTLQLDLYPIVSINGSTFTGASATITNVGNGWYRCSLSATSDTVNNVSGYLSFNSNNTQVDGTDSVSNSAGYIFGFQLEQSAYASSYIPTSSASVPRNLDTLSYSGLNHSATDMTISCTAKTQSAAAYFRIVNDSWGSITNSWMLFTVNNQAIFGKYTNGSQFNSVTGTGTISSNTSFKLAGTFSTTKQVDGTKLAVNGLLNANNVGSYDSVATSGTITQNLIYILDCGSNSFSGGNIKNLVIKNKYLDNEKLRILTI